MIRVDRGYAVAGFALVGAAASGLPTVFLVKGWRNGLTQIRLGLTFIVEFWLIAASVLAAVSCLYLVDDLIQKRAFNLHRVSRLFFWLSVFFWLFMQLVTAASGV